MKPGAGWLAWVGCCLLLAGPAMADDFTATVAASSDYVFRSETQTRHGPALQASLEYDAPVGLYVGAFGSNVSWLRDARPQDMAVHSAVELDAWGGFRYPLGHEFSYDLGLYHYAYPGGFPARGYTSPQTSEAYVQLAWGGLSLRWWYALSNWFGLARSKGSSYVDLNETWDFAEVWQLAAHLGRQSVAGYGGAASFTDWKLGLSHRFRRGWQLGVAYSRGNGARAYYSNDRGDWITRGAWVATLSRSFSF